MTTAVSCTTPREGLVGSSWPARFSTISRGGLACRTLTKNEVDLDCDACQRVVVGKEYFFLSFKKERKYLFLCTKHFV